MAVRVVAVLALLAAACGGSVAEEGPTMMIEVTGGALNAVSAADLCTTESAGGLTVLLLHGAAFNAQTWVGTGTLEMLCKNEIAAVSVDLPGFGETPRFDHDPAQLLDELAAYLGGPVVVVSPSMSGRYSLAWLSTNPTAAAGFVAVAPVGAGTWEPPVGFATPTLGIWGSEDRIVPSSAGRQLRNRIPGSELTIIDGGGHAVYMTNPDEFNRTLLEFVKSLRP